jgi:hypothetical protein
LETIRIKIFNILDAVDDDGVLYIPRNPQIEGERGGRKKAESVLNPFFCERISSKIKPALSIKWGDGAL